MSALRERIAFAVRGPIDRMQLPGSRILVERLLGSGEGLRVVRLSTGVRMRIDLGERVQRLMAFRAYERRELALMRAVLRPAGVVLDVGAHVGYYALHAAAVVGLRGQVHAFEPVPGNARRLGDNAELNGFPQMVVNQAAVSSARGRRRFGTVEIPGETGWGSLAFTEGENVVGIDVDVETVDGYAAARGLERLDFMKIDVQGNELDVLEGAQRALERWGPDVLTEVDAYCTAAAGHTPAELLGFMRARGYASWGFPARGAPVRFAGDELPGLNLFFTKRSTPRR